MKTGPRYIVCGTEDGTFEMTIKSAVRSDSGIYTCKIINEYGTKQCEGKLQVKGRLLIKWTSVWLLSSMYTSTLHSLIVRLAI